MFKKIKKISLARKVHHIGLAIFLFILILCNTGRYFYVQNKKELISHYEAIRSEDFDIDSNIENVFVYGNITCNEPIVYKNTDYAMVRNISIKYNCLDEPHNFEIKNGILYEKDILENDFNLNLSYTTEFGKGIKLGNMEITENIIGSFLPYIIDYNWNNDSYEQNFVSVININQNYVFYMESVEYGFVNGIQVFPDIQTAKEELIPSFWGFLGVSITIFIFAYFCLWFVIIAVSK